MRAYLAIASVGLSLGLLTHGCLVDFPADCKHHCWGYSQTVPDESGPGGMGPPDDRFDEPCTRFVGGIDFWPPRPALDSFTGLQCVNQTGHLDMKEVTNAIASGSVDAEETCDPTDLAFYEDMIEGIAGSARDVCVNFLTCNGMPSGCDIDLSTGGNQACTVSSAEDLCDSQVEALALAAMGDLDNGAGAGQPQQVEHTFDFPQENCDFIPEGTDTGQEPPICDDGVDGEAGGDAGDGADETGEMNVFGDVDSMIYCSPQTECTILPDLLVSVSDNFLAFYDDGVFLKFVNISGVSRGVQISGLGSGEDSYELLHDYFGIENGDLITHVNGTALNGVENNDAVLFDVMSAGYWEVTIRRQNGMTWDTLNYVISFPLTSP